MVLSLRVGEEELGKSLVGYATRCVPEEHRTNGGKSLWLFASKNRFRVAVSEFVQLCRRYGVAICVSENAGWPLIPDATADFVYARLMAGSDDIETGYEPAALDAWAARFKAYARGGMPADLAPVDGEAPQMKPRDVFAFFISEGKVRAPAAAMELIRRV